MPKVSIGMPTYQGASHLRSTIDSVLSQTFEDWELVIVDDKSSDATSSIASSYTDSRIRFLQNSNRLGPERNWNRCLSLSRGQYFKLLPQDDLLVPHCLQSQLEVLERDTAKRHALTFCARTVIDPSDRPILVRRYPGAKSGVISAQALIRRCVRFGTNLVGEPGAVMFRKELAAVVGCFDGSFSYVIDLDYWIRLLYHGDAYYLHEPLVAFRISRGSWSFSISAKQGAQFRGLMKNVSLRQRFGVGLADLTAGSLMSRANNLLRLLVYHRYLRASVHDICAP